MYMSPEAKKLLSQLDIDPAKLEIPDPNDYTVDVLGHVAEEFARHQTTLTEALRGLAHEIELTLDGRTSGNTLGTCTAVRRHDEAYHAMQALRPMLAAAADAWKSANTKTTKEATK